MNILDNLGDISPSSGTVSDVPGGIKPISLMHSNNVRLEIVKSDGNWAWKPDKATRLAISRGERLCREWELCRGWPRYLASLSPEERRKVLKNRKEYLASYKARLHAEENVMRDQMEGWRDSADDPGKFPVDAKPWVGTRERRDEES